MSTEWLPICDSRALAPGDRVWVGTFDSGAGVLVFDEEPLTLASATDDPDDGWVLSDGSWIRHNGLEATGLLSSTGIVETSS